MRWTTFIWLGQILCVVDPKIPAGILRPLWKSGLNVWAQQSGGWCWSKSPQVFVPNNLLASPHWFDLRDCILNTRDWEPTLNAENWIVLNTEYCKLNAVFVLPFSSVCLHQSPIYWPLHWFCLNTKYRILDMECRNQTLINKNGWFTHFSQVLVISLRLCIASIWILNTEY